MRSIQKLMEHDFRSIEANIFGENSDFCQLLSERLSDNFLTAGSSGLRKLEKHELELLEAFTVLISQLSANEQS